VCEKQLAGYPKLWVSALPSDCGLSYFADENNALLKEIEDLKVTVGLEEEV
jgi:hypothetical protein